MYTPKPVPVSVNWHVWPNCNYSCRFCFATFGGGPKPIGRWDALKVPRLLKDAGTTKISFAGGEPLMCPYLGELLQSSKNAGLTTMIVTNGSLITKSFLESNSRFIDWLALSIDSPSEETEKVLGRGSGRHIEHAIRAADLVRRYGIRLKMNTVVTAINWQEDMTGIVSAINPQRWKVFQMLPISRENDTYAHSLSVSPEQFRAFVARHKSLNPVAEDNNDMLGSYIMLDPAARFFQNFNNEYAYSRSILEVGVEYALSEVGWESGKFYRRGGLYEW